MTTMPVRLLIHGATGRMGQALLRLCRRAGRAAARSWRRCRARSGRGWWTGCRSSPPSSCAGVPAFDVAIDFSLPEGFDAILALCVAAARRWCRAPPGLSTRRQAPLEAACRPHPGGRGPATSASASRCWHELVERAARCLPGWDCDIVETHHVHKKDAPSGTALTLGAAAQAGGAAAAYASIRAGDIVGEHLVQFTAAGERIELVHRASNRDIFARGALHVATRLPGRAAGRYRVGRAAVAAARAGPPAQRRARAVDLACAA